ncbi:MAG: mandelate racemase/muconate lactonizing enzyme family protein [Alphaproteobacteria bacterium]
MTGHRIERVELFPVRIPYPRPMQWAGLAETAADYMLLRLVTDTGIEGVSEGTVKTTWTSTTLRSLSVAFEELFMPKLKGIAIDDASAIAALWRPREHSLAKAMIDVALWDIRSQVVGMPLWKMWQGRRDAAVSWVVTRQSPTQMAEETADMVARYGFDTLKVKGGQGIATDVEVLSAIRAAVGDGVRIYVDPNQDYSAEQAPDYCRRLADLGVLMVEDPCPYLPDAAFTRLQGDCTLPILVDNTCRDFSSARLYVERGAQAINLKLLKARGYTENWQIARHAAENGVDVNIGLFGESSLGALAALQISAALPPGKYNLPSEATLFLLLPDEYVHEPLRIRDGRIQLPDGPGFGRMVDWGKVRRLAP